MTFRNLHSPAEHRRRRQRLLRRLAIVAAGIFLASTLSFQVRCMGIRREVLRLHVIANSNSETDQLAKRYVRDQILQEGADLFDGTIRAAEAEAAITPRIAQLEDCARRALAECGLDYDVQVTVSVEYFNTRSYEEAGVTLPAGRYHAVRVILGRGEGQNWWCVMFPPLCLPAASQRSSLDAVLTAGQLHLVKSNPHYEFRFKIVELWESLCEKVRTLSLS